jgi:AraC-like DNA-binding protein/quercetin dioxygenase-like cupin family protein
VTPPEQLSKISIETIFDQRVRFPRIGGSVTTGVARAVVRNLGPVEWIVEKASHYRLPQPIFGEWHHHPDTFQVVKVLEGGGELRIGHRRFPANAGGLFWVAPRVRHSSIEPAGQFSRLIEMFFRRNVPTPCPAAVRQFPSHIPCDENPDVLITFHQIVKEFALQKPFWQWTVSGLVNHMIFLLARHLESKSSRNELTHVAGYRVDREGVARAVNHIVENYYQPIDLKSLAGVAGMSVNRFSKVFRAVEGTTPIDYVIDFRLKRASELIAERRLTLTQIAEAVGFNSIHHFSNCYKRRLGTSPSGQQARGRRGCPSAGLRNCSARSRAPRRLIISSRSVSTKRWRCARSGT